MKRLARTVRTAIPVVALASLALINGCAPGEARTPNVLRTLDERRALEVIQQTVLREGVRPAPGRDVKMPNGKSIHLDIGVEGHTYAIAYVTADDAAQLGAALPPRNQKDERLRLMHAGEDDARFVVLYQENYVYDDLVGDSHAQTTITCERQLARDVADFITHARTQGYK